MYHLRILFIMLLCIGIVQAEETNNTGADILMPFKKNLQQALLSGLAEGPEKAISVCSLEAPEIADALSDNNVRIGRASDRLRNPQNVSPEWVSPILAAYQENPSDRMPKTVALDSETTGYVEPITVQGVCLACHGEGLSSEVSAQLDELYPSDQAIGYSTGDLRGVFWTEYSNQASNAVD